MGGYSVSMVVETLFSPASLLWLVASVIAVAVLLASVSRRRSRLTESLRDYVDQRRENGTDRKSDINA